MPVENGVHPQEATSARQVQEKAVQALKLDCDTDPISSWQRNDVHPRGGTLSIVLVVYILIRSVI